MRRRLRDSWSRARSNCATISDLCADESAQLYTLRAGAAGGGFETVNQFLSAHRFAGKLAANTVAQYALWLNEATPTQHDR